MKTVNLRPWIDGQTEWLVWRTDESIDDAARAVVRSGSHKNARFVTINDAVVGTEAVVVHSAQF